MKKSSQISEQRKIAKQEITALIEETLPAKILQLAVLWIQKLMGRTTPLPWYVGAVVLTIAAMLPQTIVALVWKQPEQVIGESLIWSVAVIMVIQVIPISYLAFKYNLNFICDHLLDNIEDEKELEDIRISSVKHLGDRRRALLYSLLASIIWSALAISIFSNFNHRFIGLARSIDVWIFGFCAPGIVFYFFQILIQLHSRLGNYHYKVYELNPAQSEVVNHLATMFTRQFLAIAAYIAVCTLITSFFSQALWVTIWIAIIVILFWIPMIVEFINGQNALNKIISSAKWQALNKIQAQIRRQQESKNSDTPANIESLNRLMDLNERVYNTNSIKITARSTLELINQLLLPLVAFLVSNFDKVIKLFK